MANNWLINIIIIIVILFISAASTNDSLTDEISQLNRYLDAYERATTDLQWIENTSRQIREFRNRRATWGDQKSNGLTGQWQVSRYDNEDDDDSGDAWYNNFRKIECDGDAKMKHCSSYESSSISGTEIHKIPTRNTAFEIPNIDVMQINESPTKESDLFSYSPFLSIVENRPNLSEISSERNARSPSKLNRELNDQRDMRKNDLSHEANYKLSKSEQEKHEPLPFNSVTKKSLSPEKEINLKISNRIMDRGGDPILPSQLFRAEDENRKSLTKVRVKRSVITNSSELGNLTSVEVSEEPKRSDEHLDLVNFDQEKVESNKLIKRDLTSTDQKYIITIYKYIIFDY